MGVENVSNKGPVLGQGMSLRGANGSKLSKEETKLAQAIAGLDGKSPLTQEDLKKLQNMSPSEQIKYVNNKLNGTGYQVAKVYDSETEETSSGISWTSNGVAINFSKGGETIGVDQMGDSPAQSGHLSIFFKK